MQTLSKGAKMGIGLVLAVLAIVGALLWQVDDWSRDFTTNTATTDPDSPDPLLRPARVEASREEVVEFLARFAAGDPQWKLVSGGAMSGEDTSGEDRSGDGVSAARSADDASNEGERLRLERTTPLLRFTDDVEVVLHPTPAGIRIELSSRSRIGKGDLGQNPRNLRELRGAVEAYFGARVAPEESTSKKKSSGI